jgi:hypothetical protein
MAASAYSLYNEAKKFLNNGTIDLDTNVIVEKLFKSSSNASTFTLSTLASITNAVDAAGYNGQRALTSVVVTQGASAKQIKFDAADTITTASGANITSIMYSVIAVSGGKCIAWSKLSTAVFSVTSGNTLTNQFNAAGIFTIT